MFGDFASSDGPDGLFQWEWYQTQANRIMTAGGSAVNWWLASPYVGNGNNVYGVVTSGAAHWYIAGNSYGVAPALSI